MNGYNDDDNDDKDDDFEDDFEMPAERRFEVGVRGTPSSGMQYLHLKLHLVIMFMMVMMMIVIKILEFWNIMAFFAF